jgi:hypothetical protein
MWRDVYFALIFVNVRKHPEEEGKWFWHRYIWRYSGRLWNLNQQCPERSEHEMDFLTYTPRRSSSPSL